MKRERQTLLLVIIVVTHPATASVSFTTSDSVPLTLMYHGKAASLPWLNTQSSPSLNPIHTWYINEWYFLWTTEKDEDFGPLIHPVFIQTTKLPFKLSMRQFYDQESPPSIFYTCHIFRAYRLWHQNLLPFFISNKYFKVLHMSWAQTGGGVSSQSRVMSLWVAVEIIGRDLFLPVSCRWNLSHSSKEILRVTSYKMYIWQI